MEKVKEWDEKQRVKDFMGRVSPVFSEELVEYMKEKGFFTCPSSTGEHGRHGAFEGGNYWHSRMVAMLLREYTEKMGLTWERPESPEVIGWLHDICKMDEYMETDGSAAGAKYIKRKDTPLQGHGVKSAIIALSRMYLTDEEVCCICWHMGAFTGESKWGAYSKAIKKYPNILWVHQADMVASQVRGV